MGLNTVKFVIDKKGELRMEVVGGQGESCTAITKDIEVSLASAGSQQESGKLPEYYEGEGRIAVFNDLS